MYLQTASFGISYPEIQNLSCLITGNKHRTYEVPLGMLKGIVFASVVFALVLKSFHSHEPQPAGVAHELIAGSDSKAVCHVEIFV